MSDVSNSGGGEGSNGTRRTGDLINLLQDWYTELSTSAAAMRFLIESWECSQPSPHYDTLKPLLLSDLERTLILLGGITGNLRDVKADLHSKSRTGNS